MTDPSTRPVGGDQVFVDALVRSIEVGILRNEHGTRQRVRFSVRLTLTAEARAEGDAPAVSYVDIVSAIDALTVIRWGLIEALAEAIAARLLGNPSVARVDATVEKLDRMPEGTYGVTIARERA